MEIPPPVRVKVERSGRILLDGNPVSLAQLRKTLPAAKASRAGVRYYREGSRNEASRKALAVWEVVMDSGLPVELCDDEAQFRGETLGVPKEEKPDDDIWWA